MTMRKLVFDRVSDSWEFQFRTAVDGQELPVPDLVSHCAYLVDPDDASLVHVALRLKIDVLGSLMVTARGGAQLSHRSRGGSHALVFKVTADLGSDPRSARVPIELMRGEVVHFYLRLPADGAA